MKTNFALALGLVFLSVLPAGAIPEPDNIVYGLIYEGTNAVTAQRTDLTVEVRYSGDTNLVSTNILSSYRMGHDPSLGNYYAVIIPLWTALDVLPMTGSNLVLRVTQTVVGSGTTNYLAWYTDNMIVGARGEVLRLDFGAPPDNPIDTFDAWADALGLPLDSEGLDPDGDGLSNFHEYLAGTGPTDPDSKLLLRISQNGDFCSVSFDALKAEGPGYVGRTRHYALESVLDLSTSDWEPLPGCSNLIGINAEVVYNAPATNATSFFRVQVWLDP